MVRLSVTLTILCLTYCIAEKVKHTDEEDNSHDSTQQEELNVPVAGGAKVYVPVKSSEDKPQSETPKSAEVPSTQKSSVVNSKQAPKTIDISDLKAALAELPPEVAEALTQLPIDEDDWMATDVKGKSEASSKHTLELLEEPPQPVEPQTQPEINTQAPTAPQNQPGGAAENEEGHSTASEGSGEDVEQDVQGDSEDDYDEDEDEDEEDTEDVEGAGEQTVVDIGGEDVKIVDGTEEKVEQAEEVTEILTPEQLEAKELYESAISLQSSGTLSSNKRAYQLFAGAAALNHTEARALVAFSYLTGDYVTRNVSKALEMFEQLNSEGNPRGQLGLGIMYSAGLYVNSSQAKSLIYFTFAAVGEDELAQMILGYRHLSGVGVQSSCETALIYYGKAARKVASQVSSGGGPIVQRIRLNDDSETSSSSSNVLDDDLIQYYQFLADKGDTSAQVGLGQLYYQGGRGVSVDHDLAFYYFTQASRGGEATADAYLGKMYAEGAGSVEQNYETAYQYFLKSAEEENAIGQCGLGMLYLKGNYVEKDLSKAVKYFQKSADKNWVDGQLQLGLMYSKGEGVRRDAKAALKYFQLASQNGNVLALYNLAQMHASGSGVMRACHTAVELYKNVAERGAWSKLLMEAYDFYKRGYVDVALFKYFIAAELGYEVAQSNVAHILDSRELDVYETGEQYKRALLQWTRAAGQGSAVARIKLGDYHYYGLGTDVDYEQAIQHYRVAGEQQSNAQAMYNLAYMHEAGLGLKQDLHLAKRFYDMAAETSKDAHIPVTLALTRLSLLSQLDSFTNSNNIWSSLANLHPQAYLGPTWDMYIITVLGVLFGLLVMLRTHLLQPA